MDGTDGLDLLHPQIHQDALGQAGRLVMSFTTAAGSDAEGGGAGNVSRVVLGC